MKIINETIINEMATVGSFEVPGLGAVKVTIDSDRGSHNSAYIKVYNSTNVYNRDTKLIRLSFYGNEYYRHRGRNKFWAPSQVPYKILINWLKDKSNNEPELTNWQYALLMWNRECNLPIPVNQFISGEADLKYKEITRYVPSTTPIPNWNKNIKEG